MNSSDLPKSDSTIDPGREFQEGLRSHRLGDLASAEVLYLKVLGHDPEHFDALHMLGVLRYQQGQHLAAAELIRQAIRIRPGEASAWVNLGLAYQRLRHPDEALANYDRALALRPGYANALVNRGNALQDLARHEDAVASYERALSLQPDHVEALFNRGNALQELTRYREALASFERVLELRPDHAKALLNRGIVLLDLECHEQALASFERALALNPAYPEALNNRGLALRALKQDDDALAAFDQALRLRPNYEDALGNRADVLDALGRDAEAVDAFERLIEVAPDHDYALGKLHRCRQRLCDWRTVAADTENIVTAVRRGRRAVTPFAFLATTQSTAEQLQCARIYAADRYPASATPMWTGQRYAHERIRIAYLSADFREHAVSYLTAGLFERHDRARFEPIGISFAPKMDNAMTRRVRSAFGRFVDVADKNDREVASLLREMEVDIAVDLMGYTLHGRTGVFAHRPAPIQVNYLGFPGTMGADYIDYIIADDFVIPPECQRWHAEKVVYLPHSFQANDDRRPRAEKTPTRPEAGLPESGFAFCSFNSPYKINPTMFDLWMRLLRRVSGSLLWLVGRAGAAMDNLRREAANRGVAPDRLVFAPEVRYADHLARLRLADLFLDTLPFNAGTTASDALWCGVPVLTCSGEAFASRMAGSLLRAIGLPELVTFDLQDYEALALKLAGAPALLADFRARLERNRSRSPLFDTDRFRRHIEQAYATMWERFRHGGTPESFAVQPTAR